MTSERCRVRIVSWNVRAGVTPRKLDLLLRLAPDVAVLCELQPGWQPPEGWGLLLRDDTSSRVLGVLTAPGWKADVAVCDPGLPWLLPVELESPTGARLRLLAVWTVQGAGRPSYVAQTQQALTAWESACEADGHIAWSALVLAGDLNASLQSTDAPKHRTTLDMLEQRGLVSAYHHSSGVAHGAEPRGTLRWVGKGGVVLSFHCDYAFVSRDLLPGTTSAVGAMEDWCGPGLSDHVPVIVDLARPLA